MSARLVHQGASVVTGCLLMMAAGGIVHAQMVSGTVSINNDKFKMKYGAAALVPDSFDKAKLQVRLVFADQPVPQDLIADEAQVWDLKSKSYHGLEIQIALDKSNYSVFVISSTIQGSVSRSGTFDGKQLSVFTDKRVEGAMQVAPEDHGGTMLGYSLKFALDIAPQEAAPTAADAAAATGKESVKAYLSLVDAIRSGNKQQILELAPPERRAMIDTPQFPEMLKMVQMMTPQKIQVLKATEIGDKSTLIARGISEGKAQRGKIYLIRANGKWLVTSETWGSE
jgi:hypothetical protein